MSDGERMTDLECVEYATQVVLRRCREATAPAHMGVPPAGSTVSTSMNPLEVTEWLLRQPPPITRGLIVNMPARGMSHADRLYQAGVWREYAMVLSGAKTRTRTGVDSCWIREIGRYDLAQCKRRARVNLYLAHRLH